MSTIWAQDYILLLCLCFTQPLTSKDPQSYHGEGDEGDKGHEAGEHHREEQACAGYRVPRAQDEDREWAHGGGPVQEQAREDREEEGEPLREEEARSAKTLGGWNNTVLLMKARKALNVKGFVAVKKGSPLYKKAKEFYGQ